MNFKHLACSALGLSAICASAQVELQPVGRFGFGTDGAAEIVDYDSVSQRMFITNSDSNTLDIVSLTTVTNPTLVTSVDLSIYGGGPNSVAVTPAGLALVAVENTNKQANGEIVAFDTDGAYVGQVTAGALPDMVAVSPNGRFAVVANEGEPSDDYTVDPEGTISVIDLWNGASVATVDFTSFNGQEAALAAQTIRVFGPNATVAQDFEPEYVTISEDSTTAWVSLQENNAIVEINLLTASVNKLLPLGYKDHLKVGNAMDASNQDGGINIRRWPTRGLYQPDAIANFTTNGITYILTANEGDARDYAGFSEEARVKDLTLVPHEEFFPGLQATNNLGRLKTTLNPPDNVTNNNGTNVYSAIYSYGARSFTILTKSGVQVFDSGNEFETIAATQFPAEFNGSGAIGNIDSRSDDKGPEPEAVVTGIVNGRRYAFIGLERIGGVMVYDVTEPSLARFVQYAKNQDFNDGTGRTTADDRGPEGLKFIPASDSPNGNPLLLVSSEVSGTVTVYEVQ